jgi:hypothetical protein
VTGRTSSTPAEAAAPAPPAAGPPVAPGTGPAKPVPSAWRNAAGEVDWAAVTADLERAVDVMLAAAVADGRLHQDSVRSWRDYFLNSGRGSVPRAKAALNALPTGVYAKAAAPAAGSTASTTRPAATAAPPVAGAVPQVTASGMDPALLAHLPWQARGAVAAAETYEEAYRLYQMYSGPDGEEFASLGSWVHGHATYGAEQGALLEQEAARVDAMSEDELYDSVAASRPPLSKHDPVVRVADMGLNDDKPARGNVDI